MKLILTLGDRCHRSCSYCYADLRRSGTMTLDVARRSIDSARTADGTPLQIGFFGGEPLLNFPLLREIADHARRTCELTPSFSLTTSGDFLDEEVAEYFGGIDIDVALSAHDEDGGVVRRAARRLRAVGIRPSVVMVATPENCSGLRMRMESFLEAGIRRLAISPEFYEPWTVAARARLAATYVEIVELYRRERDAGRPFVFNQFEPRLRALESGVSLRSTQCEVGPGQLSVAPDGSLYPCDRLSVDSSCSSTRIGHVDQWPDGTCLNELAERASSAELCEGCEDSLTCLCSCACVNTHLTGSVEVVPEVVRWHEQLVGGLVRELHREGPSVETRRRDQRRFIRLSAGLVAAGALATGCGDGQETKIDPLAGHVPDEVCQESGRVYVGEFALALCEDRGARDRGGEVGSASVRYCLHLEEGDNTALLEEHKAKVEERLRERISRAHFSQLTLPEEERALGLALMEDVREVLGADSRMRGITLTIQTMDEYFEDIRGRLMTLGYVGY